MIGYSAEARDQIAALQADFERKGRLEAVRNLSAALIQAEQRIKRDPAAGLPAPRRYPALIRSGRLWTKVGRYWIAYSRSDPPIILAIFYDQADIAGRL